MYLSFMTGYEECCDFDALQYSGLVIKKRSFLSSMGRNVEFGLQTAPSTLVACCGGQVSMRVCDIDFLLLLAFWGLMDCVYMSARTSALRLLHLFVVRAVVVRYACTCDCIERRYSKIPQ